MSLLQNNEPVESAQRLFDYQSECHCSKTKLYTYPYAELFDYQSECRCSKTRYGLVRVDCEFDYQSECHCSKTGFKVNISDV